MVEDQNSNLYRILKEEFQGSKEGVEYFIHRLETHPLDFECNGNLYNFTLEENEMRIENLFDEEDSIFVSLPDFMSEMNAYLRRLTQ
ncbi:MAG: hypothetical protein JJ879_08305 [Sneathiella sp.]|nr:hypothetical protein [Sneathiella sp.]